MILNPIKGGVDPSGVLLGLEWGSSPGEFKLGKPKP